MKLCASLLASTILASGYSFGAALAADLATSKGPAPMLTQLPAVDGVNGKVELFGAATWLPNQPEWSFPFPRYSNGRRTRGAGGGAGALSVPLGGQFGAQFESMIATWNGQPVVGVGGHLFWRNPSVGLLGVYSSASYFGTINGIGVARVAAEGEAYLGRFTLEGMAGVETGKRRYESWGQPGVTFLNVPYYSYNIWNTKTRFYDKATISYYVTDNFKISAGQLYTGGKLMATLGAEYAFALAPGMAASLFLDGNIGARNTAGVRGGLKVYFGRSDKTLIRRHREDDPPINLPLDIYTISNSQSGSVTPLPTTGQVCKDFEGNVIPCGKP